MGHCQAQADPAIAECWPHRPKMYVELIKLLLGYISHKRETERIYGFLQKAFFTNLNVSEGFQSCSPEVLELLLKSSSRGHSGSSLLVIGRREPSTKPPSIAPLRLAYAAKTMRRNYYAEN